MRPAIFKSLKVEKVAAARAVCNTLRMMMRLIRLFLFLLCAFALEANVADSADLSDLAGYGYLTEVSEAGEFAPAADCGECHKAIYAEWSESPHARAFVSATFRDATDGHRFSDCLSCHAPDPTSSDTAPALRTFARDEGVTCVSCHLRDGRMWGPHKPSLPVQPHPVGTDLELYSDSRFCGRCHQGTYAEWQSAKMDEKPSCQDCHMPPVTRKMASPKNILSVPFSLLENEFPQKRHTFDLVPTDLDEPTFEIAAERLASTVTLTIVNHLPHSLPPGDFGVRVVAVEVTAQDARGNRQTAGRREFFLEGKRAVPPRSSARAPISVPAGAVSLSVRMTRQGRDRARLTELLTTEVPLREPR